VAPDLLRILHLTRDFPPRHAGGLSSAVGALVATAHTHAAGLHAVISFDGWRPTRAATAHRTARLDTDVPAPILRVEGPADLDAASSFAAHWRPDAIHVHHAMLGDFGDSLATTLQRPLLATTHVLQFQLSNLRGISEPTLSDTAETRLFARADALSAPTRAAMAMLATHPDAARRPTSLTRLGAPSPDPTTTRAASGPPHLISVGRFDPLKGTDTLVAAIPVVLSRHPDLRVTLLGGVPENHRADRRWRERFNSTCLGFGPRFRIEPWSSPEAVARLMYDATHLVAPSRAETCGLAVLEAYARGLVVIASDIAPHREVAPEAFFFAADSPENLVATITRSLATHHPSPRHLPPTWSEVLPDWVHFWEKWR
jgi:glycogen(starch) synthase